MDKIYRRKSFGSTYDDSIDQIILGYKEEKSILIVQSIVDLASNPNQDNSELKRILTLKSLKYKILSENITSEINSNKSLFQGPYLIYSFYIGLLILYNKFTGDIVNEYALLVILSLMPILNWYIFFRENHIKTKEANKLKKISYLLECAEKVLT